MAQRPTGGRDAGLPSYQRLTRRLTRPRLWVVDEDGRRVDAPDDLRALVVDELPRGGEAIDPEDRPIVEGAIERARHLGMARAMVRLDAHSTPSLLNVADLREDYGVVACLVSEDEVPDEVTAPPQGSPRPTPVGASVSLSTDGRVVAVHGAIEGVLSEVGGHVGQRLAAYVHPDDQADFEATLSEHGAVPEVGRRVRMRLRTHDGGWRWVDALLHDRVTPDGSRLTCVLSDVDADVRAQQALVESEYRFRTFLEAVPVGVFGADDVGRIRIANDAFKSVTGIDPAADDWLELVHPDDSSLLVDAIQRFGFSGDVLDTEIRLRRGDSSSYRTARVLARAIRAPDGKLLDVIGSIEDVTERKQLAERLAFEASHDALTGLANRSAIERELERRLERRHSTTTPLAVLFIDLDGFKRINDSLGHRAGDELLLRLGQRLAKSSRLGDAVGRFGGDEFVVVSEHAGDPDGALTMAHRLLDQVCEPVEVAGATLRPRASVGIAIATGPTDAEILMRDADAAMYEAKARGPSAVWLADADVRNAAARRFELEAVLAEALVDDEHASFAYQPVTDLESGRMLGVEALLRWESPDFGSTSPGEIIPIAEESGLIHELTEWTVVQAARDLGRMVDAGLVTDEFHLGVNLSSSQLSAPGMVEQYLATIAAAGVEPGDLVVEVTETDFIEAASAAADALHALDAHGVPLALDDFGAGFSSFDYLTRLPIRFLKVDRSLIGHASRSARARAVLRGIVAISDDLDVSPIAEGVETPAEREACLEAGLTRGQGFLIARPMPVDDLLHWSTPGRAVVPG